MRLTSRRRRGVLLAWHEFPINRVADQFHGIVYAILSVSDTGSDRSMQRSIPCLFMRGGTSRGPFFLESDLPRELLARDAALLAIMGSPDARQIDGLGGADTLTSKVGIVRRGTSP